MKLTPFLIVASTLLGACASNTTLFPQENTSLTESELVLPNPIDVVVDAANDQLIVVNSNIDFYFEQGTIYTLSVNATDADQVVLAATSARAIPNFATDAQLNAGVLYVPYREAATDTADQIESYTVGAGALTDLAQGTVGQNPFGSTILAGSLYVVNDESVTVLDTNLDALEEIDLTVAATSGLVNANAKHAESIAADAANNRLYVSNRDGKVFVLDAATNEMTHIIDGPDNSRGLVTDGSRIFLINGDAPVLWVMDLSLLPAANGSIQEVDDATITVAQIDLGVNPNGIAYDAGFNRVYVTNLGDNSISVIDANLLAEIARISFNKEDTGFDFNGEQPFAVTTGTFDGVPLVFVANIDPGETDTGTLFVINAATLKIVSVFPNP